MLFKSLGIATATNSASNSEESKPVTIRLTDSEIQLYDAVSKSMGLTRQDFLAHLIRNNFKSALQDFFNRLYGIISVSFFVRVDSFKY